MRLCLVQVQSGPGLWPRLYSTSRTAMETERNWMCTSPGPALWVLCCHPSILHLVSHMTLNGLHHFLFRRQPCYLHTRRLLAISQVRLFSDFLAFYCIFRDLAQASYFFTFSVRTSLGSWPFRSSIRALLWLPLVTTSLLKVESFHFCSCKKTKALRRWTENVSLPLRSVLRWHGPDGVAGPQECGVCRSAVFSYHVTLLLFFLYWSSACAPLSLI